MSGHTTWWQGHGATGAKYVFVPGLAKPINAGTADRAALIVESVNDHVTLLSALQAAELVFREHGLMVHRAYAQIESALAAAATGKESA